MLPQPLGDYDTCPPCAVTSARRARWGRSGSLGPGGAEAPVTPAGRGRGRGGAGSPPKCGVAVRTRGGSPRDAHHRFFSQQALPGPAIEFPDLGAHCSESSCQRLGKGRSARWGRAGWRGAWSCEWGEGWAHGNWKCPRGAGLEVGAVSKGAWLRVMKCAGVVCCK